MAVALKICGVTRSEDLEVCRSLGVDAVGINLWPGSRRGLTREAAARLLERAGPGGPLRVGVFVDAGPQEVLEIQRALGLDAVQLHGDAPIEPYAALGIPYVWVLRGTPDLEQMFVPEPAPAWILLDAHVAGYGGAGRRTDWAWAQRAVKALAPIPVWLAGGIDPGNAAQALAAVQPAGLDVASGAERAPGEKDPDEIAALLSVCRARDPGARAR